MTDTKSKSYNSNILTSKIMGNIQYLIIVSGDLPQTTMLRKAT